MHRIKYRIEENRKSSFNETQQGKTSVQWKKRDSHFISLLNIKQHQKFQLRNSLSVCLLSIHIHQGAVPKLLTRLSKNQPANIYPMSIAVITADVGGFCIMLSGCMNKITKCKCTAGTTTLVRGTTRTDGRWRKTGRSSNSTSLFKKELDVNEASRGLCLFEMPQLQSENINQLQVSWFSQLTCMKSSTDKG